MKTKTLFIILLAGCGVATSLLIGWFAGWVPCSWCGAVPNENPEPVPLALSTMNVSVFFLNDQLDPEITCQKVFPVKRSIPETQAIARAALEELLKGPTSDERAAGWGTTIPDGVRIQSLSVVDGVARADFSEELDRGIGGSCRVTAIRRQITETLKQFPTVESVVISIDGRTEDILQP